MSLFNDIFYFVKKGKYLLLLTVILAIMCLILYKEYIFGGKLFLFEDIGSDTIRVSYPTYIYYFRMLHEGITWWSDKMGIGTSVLSHSDIVFDPFTYILYLFGENNIARMFVYMVITKIIVAGIFFWVYLSQFKLSTFAKYIGSITYAFGGFMILVGQHYVFGTIYAYMPLIFLGFELWIRKKNKWLMIIMLTLTALYFYYFFYMTLIFFCIYAIFRYFLQFKFKSLHFFKYIFSAGFYILLSIGLSAFYLLPSLSLAFSNLRVGKGYPGLGELLFPDFRMVITVFGRIFGYDTLGNIYSYLGYGNDFFMLALYCGVITLVLLPQIFIQVNKRKKLLYTILFAMIIIMLFIPIFPFVFSGFSDINYRWIYILHFSFALLLSISINSIFNNQELNITLLIRTVIILFIIAVTAIVSNSYLHKDYPIFNSFRIFLKDFILIIIYVFLTYLFFKTSYKMIIKIFILIIVCFEMIWFPYNIINDRKTYSENPIENKIGYFDYTNEAVYYINKFDKNIFRIEKSYNSYIDKYDKIPSNNDSMVQNFRGIKSYNANNQSNYIRFLQDAGIYVMYPYYKIPRGTRPQDIGGEHLNYINGVGDRYLLLSFLGVKYYLTDTATKPPPYFQFLTKIKNINIYKNNYYLPISFTIDNFITYKEYMSLDNASKDITLLTSAVIDDPFILSGSIQKTVIKYLTNTKSEVQINNLIAKRQKNNFKIEYYNDDHIKGSISLDRNQILVFTIPYDQGWTIFVDGEKNKLLKIDNGLIGIELKQGHHSIELKYFPPLMNEGIMISIISLIGLILISLFNKKITYLSSLVYINSVALYNGYLNKRLKNLNKQLFLYIITMNKILNLNSRKIIFYLSSLIGILAFFVGGFISRGYSFYNLFQSDKTDYFMDFFKPLSELLYGPYAQGSIYPPLAQLFYKIMLRLIPIDIAQKGAFVTRSSQNGQLLFLIYSIFTLSLFIFILIKLKKGTYLEKYIFTLITLFSAPFLFLFERANIIFIALIFLMLFIYFKDSKIRICREISFICLAISSGIKIYPVIFIILLIKEKRFNDTLRFIIYLIFAFVIPLLALGGISQLTYLIRNIISTTNNSQIWGLGYSSNIQSIVRIFYAYIGDYGTYPVFMGKIVSIIVLISGIFSSFYIKSAWKTVAILILLMISFPPISFVYANIFMIIPLIMFLDKDNKFMKSDYIFLICFILIMIPFTLSKIDTLTAGFGKAARPFTYGLLFQNLALFIMTMTLIIQGLTNAFTKMKEAL